MGFQGSCPSCGGSIEFRFENSVTVVCPHCESLVGRSGGSLEDYGKVSDLTQSDSPLKTGLSGMVKDRTFDITGRIQLKHTAGAVWSEWFIAFDSGEKWGWLAEAQGRYYLTFPKELPADAEIAPFEDVAVEQKLSIPGHGKMTVVEKGEATIVAAEGEIPFSVRAGEVSRYLDLQGSAGKFATLGDSDGQWELFVGGEFPLRRLGISEWEESRDGARAAEAVSVSCPNCGGAIEVKEPAKAERYACVYCDSLLDCTQGSLKFLQALKQRAVPTLPLGTQGTLRGESYTIIGFVRRHVPGFDWDEYLLQSPRRPFHWLIHSDGHWSLGKPLSAGDVLASFSHAVYKGKKFKLFERSAPVVKAVYGEFYWKVRLGERVTAWDYVRAPLMISREISQYDKSDRSAGGDKPPRVKRRIPPKIRREEEFEAGPTYRDRAAVARAYQQQMAQSEGVSEEPASEAPVNREVNYTLGEYVPVNEIKTAFDIERLPRPTGVGPHQPFQLKSIYAPALGVLLVALVLGGLVSLSKRSRKVGEGRVAVTGWQASVEQGPLEIKSGSNIRVTLRSPSLKRGEWLLVKGRFYDEANKVLLRNRGSFSALVRSNQSTRKLISALPTSRYTLRATVTSGSGTTSKSLTGTGSASPNAAPGVKPASRRSNALVVRVDQNVWSGGNLVLLLGLLAVPLGGVGLLHFTFETQRWKNSGDD